MFSERLKELRKKNNITQEQVAKHLGVKRSTYSNYEYGNREPDNETLNKIADYFEVSVDYLLGRDGNRGYLSDEQAWKIVDIIMNLSEHRKEAIINLLKSYEEEK